MICPINVDSKLMEINPARATLLALTGIPQVSPIREAIKYNLESFPDYYDKAYPSLQNLSFLDKVNHFYSLVRNVEGKVVGTNIVNDKVTSLFPTPEVNVKSRKYNEMVTVLDRLSGLFDFPYVIINDPNSNFKGKYINRDGVKTVVINIAHSTSDTPFHEYFHPFVRILRDSNPELFEKISNEASFIKGEREEAVTEYLGKIAASTYRNSSFQKFIDFISDLISSYLGINFRLKPSDTVRDVVNSLLTNGVDVSSENTLEEAFQLLDQIDKNTNVLTTTGREEKALQELKDYGSRLTTSDTSDYYQEDGEDKYRRITSFSSSKTNGEFTFIFPNRKSKDANDRALAAFKNQNLSPTDKIKINDIELTFDELVEYYEHQAKIPVLKGKLIHAYIDYLTKEGHAKEDSLKLAEELAKQLGTPYIKLSEHPDLKTIDTEWDQIQALAGLTRGTTPSKFDDKIESEITLFSNILVDKDGKNLGSTADAVIHKYNGDMGLVDYKSGNILSDFATSILMPYGSQLGVKDSKLNHGFLELALRAIMIKEKFPDQKFSFLRIVKVDKYSQHEAHDANLEVYLQVIGNYYAKNHPKVFKELNEKGLLDYSSYVGTSAASNNYSKLIEGKTREEAVSIIDAKLAEYQAMPYQGKQPEFISNEIKTLTEVRLELEGYNDIKVDLTTDKNTLIAKFSTLADLDKRSIKGLNELITKARKTSIDERNKHWSKWDSLLDAVYKERPNYGSKTNLGLSKLATAGVALGVVTLNPFVLAGSLTAAFLIRRANTSTKETFGFMYLESTDPDSPGFYLNTTDYHNGKPLTTAEKELRDYYKNTLSTLYKETMGQVVDVKYGRKITKADVMKLPNEMPDNFIVRPPKSLDEIKEEGNQLQNFFGIKPYFEHALKSNIVSVIERNSASGQRDDVFYPVKNFHTRGSIVEAQMHSFNPDLGFKLMVDNLTHKKHFDNLYPVAQGVRNIIADATTPDGKAALPNTLSALDAQIMQQVQGKDKEISWKTSPQIFSVGKYRSKLLGIPQGEYELNQDKIARSLKSGLGFVTMAFKGVSAAKNFTIITITNGIKITSGFTGKLLGVNPDGDKYALAAAASLKDMSLYWKDSLFENKRNNKLHLLAEKFDWLPDNYAFGAAKSNLFKDITKPSVGGTAYLFHNFAESYGALTHLSATLRSQFIEVNGKKISLYDAYKVENGELVWKGGVRGVNELGETVSELDTKEIKTLKRAYERTQGSYRPEEKTAIEVTVFGQFLMQFKKYFYTYLKVNFQSEIDDPTIGRYITVKDMTRPDGYSTLQWESEIMKGRINTAYAGIFALLKGDKSYLQGRKGEANKKRIAELMATGMWMAALFLAYIGFDDDEDKISPRERLFAGVMSDAASGLTLKDYISTMKSPIVLLSRGSQIGQALLDYVGNDADGNSIQKRKVDQAVNTLERTIPFLSNKQMFQELISNATVDSEDSFLEIFKSK